LTVEPQAAFGAWIREVRMKSAALAAIALALFIPDSVASAEEASPPKTTATRPAKEHPEQTSVPSNAPPASRTQTTGSTSQDPAVQKMNAEGKQKLEIEGK
jgi:ABC-type phosphate transport system substrate-binding protein